MGDELNEELLKISNKKIDIEPKSVSLSKIEVPTSGKRTKDSAFSRLSRELSEEDLNASGTKKMILNLVDTLNAENGALRVIQLKYYEIDKQLAVLKEKHENLNVNINIKNIISIVGSMLFGFLPSLYERKWSLSLLIVIGVMSLIMALMPYILMMKRHK